jgi:hypothetical protein
MKDISLVFYEASRGFITLIIALYKVSECEFLKFPPCQNAEKSFSTIHGFLALSITFGTQELFRCALWWEGRIPSCFGGCNGAGVAYYSSSRNSRPDQNFFAVVLAFLLG